MGKQDEQVRPAPGKSTNAEGVPQDEADTQDGVAVPLSERRAVDAAGRGAKVPAATPRARSLNERPEDPNAAPAKIKLPPGVEPEEVRDPGRQTPEAPPVDNRTGGRDGKK